MTEFHWISWDRTKVAHAVSTFTDYRVGSFPMACGTWAPDAWDVGALYPSSKRHCRRCVKAVEKFTREAQER